MPDDAIHVYFRTLGKGCVQAQISCGDGDYLSLTAADGMVRISRGASWSRRDGPDPDGGEYLRALLDGRSDVQWKVNKSYIPNIASGSGTYVDVVVAAVSAGGAGTVLMATLGKLFTRHQDKTVEFDVDGELKIVRGYSAKDVERIVKALELGERKLVRRDLRKALEELLAEDAESDDGTSGKGQDPR